MSVWSKIGKAFKTAFQSGFSPYGWLKAIFGSKLPYGDEIDSFIKGRTGSGLTNAQIEQNEWNSQEAQVSREWQEQMSNTQYQRQVADMKSAGLNPAMMYGGTTSTSVPSGATASGSSVAAPSGGVLDSIMSLFFAKQRFENLKAEGDLIKARSQAELLTAWSNYRNSVSNERQATVAEIRASIEKSLADSNIEVNAASVEKMAEESANIRETRQFISKYYDLAVKNADSLQKQSIAAIRQADAAIQNASTQSYVADYNTDLMYSEVLLNSIVKGEHEEIYKNLPEKLRLEVDNLRKQGLVLDEQKRLIHRQGNLATANTVRSYVGTACDVANTVAAFTTGGTGASSGSIAPYVVGSTSFSFP